MKVYLPPAWLATLLSFSLRTSSVVHAMEWRFGIDLGHDKVINEGTDNDVTVFFWGRKGNRTACPVEHQESTTYFPQHDEWLCLESKHVRTATLSAEKNLNLTQNFDNHVNITAVVLSISGTDAMYIDRAWLTEGGSVINSWGVNGGKGWCMSTDQNDATSWYKYLGTDTCSSFILWDVTNKKATKCASADEVCAFEALLSPADRWYHDSWKTPSTVEYNHNGVIISPRELISKAPLSNFGFRMNSDDDYTRRWRPQGITGFRFYSEYYIVVSWYERDDPKKGSRITLHRYSSPSHPYRRILLVDENLDPVRHDWKAGGCAYRDGDIHCIDNDNKIAHVFSIEEIEKVDSNAGHAYSYVIRRKEKYNFVTDHGDYMSAAYDLGAGWFLYGNFTWCNGSVDFHEDHHLNDCHGSTDNAIAFYNPSTGEHKECKGPFTEDTQGAIYFKKDGNHIMVTSSSYKGNKVSHLHAFVFNPDEDCNGSATWNNLAYTTIHLPPGSEDLYAEDRGNYVWTVTEFGDNPDCFNGKNHREVLRYAKVDLMNAALGNANYEFVVNYNRNDIGNEHTTCASFFSQKGTRSQCPDDEVVITNYERSYCYEGEACLNSVSKFSNDARYELPGQPDRPISTVVLRTEGGDALYVDYCWLKNNLISHDLMAWGTNNGGGWCISKEADDWRGDWDDYDSSNDCHQSVIFDIEEERKGGLGGSYYNCPSSVGHCNDTTLFHELLGKH